MKKLYCKPEVHYESFDLMDAIASCTLTATQGDPNSCTYYDQGFGVTLFANELNGCAPTPPEYFEGMVDMIFGS